MNGTSVTKDQEFIVKKQVSEWARSLRIKNFDENFEILECINTDLYEIKIKERLCKRSFSNEMKPFESESIESGPIKDIWKYSTDGMNSSKTDLSEALLSEEFFNSLKNNPKILKENKLESIVEKFDNFEDYKNSLIAINQSTYPIPASYDLVVCPNCVGKGTTICYNCNGSGKTSCYRCDGTKWITHYNAPRERCSSCNGTGYKVCTSCDGAKRKICYTCDGKGKALKYVALNELFTVIEEYYNYNEIIPENLKDLISEKAEYDKLEEIEVNSNNRNSICKSNQLLNDVPKLKETVNWRWEEIEKSLEKNQKIDKLNFSFSKTNVTYLKYKYNDKEYELCLYGKDYQIVCTEAPNMKHKNQNHDGNYSTKNRTAALLLCLFFGWLGVHRFYARRYITGILEMVSSLFMIGFIWEFIDLIIILCGKFKDKEKKYIIYW